MKTDGWRSKLIAYIDAHERAPFKPGRHDCALFVAGAVEVQSGVDLAAKWRGKYKSIAGGVRLMQKAGFADHLAFVEAVFDQVQPSIAKTGDIGAVDTPDGLSLGIVVGAQVYVVAPSGLGVLPRTKIVKAWSTEAQFKTMEI